MKKLIYIAALCGALVGCSDFLEVESRTQVPPEDVYNTEEGVMKGLYATMKEVSNRVLEVHSYNALLSDEAETGGGIGEGSYKVKWDTFIFSPINCFNNEYYTGTGWWNEWDMGLYTGVVAANILIDYIEGSTLSESFLAPIEAEARFLRALFYHYLFMGYREAPIVPVIKDIESLYGITNTPRQEMYEFIMNDLSDEYIDRLPEKAATQKGRVSVDAAKLLRVKTILFHRDEAKYPAALADIKSIIAKSNYKLVADYQSLWRKAGEWGTESIYEIGMAGEESGMQNKIATVGGREIVDPRSAEQGGLMAGHGQLTMTWPIYDMFAPGDTRRDGTVIVYADEAADALDKTGQDTFAVSSSQEGINAERGQLGNYKYHPRKESYTSGGDPVNNQNMSFRFYRFSDVLLLGAELSVRINGTADAEAQGWFDQVRDRAFGDTDHRIALNQGKDANLDVLFDERFYELAFEMQRYFDILRFDKGTEILGGKGWTEKHRYFPIDQNEIDQSGGSLVQDPAWL